MNYPILSLRVVRFNDETVAEPMAVEFGPAGGTIGRASDCTLVLPDQQRAISRVHARVEFRGGDYLLCDLGSNPSVLNQRALGGTREARLADGDRLLVGTYLLEVSIGDSAVASRGLTGARDPLSAAQVLGGPLPAESPGDPLRMGALDPLGQPGFGEPQRISTRPAFTGSESHHVSPELQAFTPPRPAQPAPNVAQPPPASGIPADYDPLADALSQWETPAQTSGASQAPARGSKHELGAWPATTPGASVSSVMPVTPVMPVVPVWSPPTPHNGPTGLPGSLLDGPIPGAAATPFDDLFAAPAESRVSAPPEQPARARPVAPASPISPTSPTELNVQVASSPAMPPSPIPTPASAQRANFTTAVSPTDEPAHNAKRATRDTAPRENDLAAAGSNTATLHALLEGLGLDPTAVPNLPEPEFARLIGAMLRESLRGTMAVLRARSMTKREARLDTTMIVARDNNPLKFFPDVDSALAQMLTGRSAGYLPPDEALKRAFNDIEAHELAVIAGMRAALAHVLGRFDPALIEARLKEPGALEKVLSNRKAKLWDQFVDLHAAAAQEAEDDFQKLFGQAFNAAYEAQIEALHAARER